MRRHALFTRAAAALAPLALAAAAAAQEHDAPKIEIGVQYSSLSVNLPTFGGTENAVGFGARVTYNLNDYFAVEAEGNLYPTGIRAGSLTGGAARQAQFGVRAGKRWNRFGLFARARPGLVSYDSTFTPERAQVLLPDGTTFGSVRFARERKTHFSADLGGVLEFYPSRRVLVRFDAGDTVNRYGEHDVIGPFPLLPGGGGQIPIIKAAGEVTHNFQFTAGVGFRFRGGGAADDAGARSPGRDGVRRFEAGIQFSSLALRLSPERFGAPASAPPDEGSQAEAGFGGRVGYNLTDGFALEAEGNFYPRRRYAFDTTAGGYPAQMQFGAKAGRRFERFGLFAKARPGFVTFSNVARVTGFETFTTDDGRRFFFPTFDRGRKTYFSVDVGGVLEFYPTRRLLTRFDLGDTIIRYGVRDNPGLSTTPTPPRIPGEVRHNLQFTAGLGLRF